MKSPQVIDYPPSLVRDQLHVDRSAGGIRIITPPLKDWRKLPRSFFIAFAAVAICVVLALMMGLRARSRDDRISAMVMGLIYGFVLVTLIAWAIDRLGRRFGFEITPTSFTMMRIASNAHISRWQWRRSAVGEVKIALTGKLHIQFHGTDPLDVFISSNRVEVEQLVSALQEAFRSPIAHGGEMPPWPLDALPPGKQRTALLVVSGFIAVVGIAVGIFVNPSLCFFPMLLAAVPAGLALGTQEKEYYM